MRNVGSARILMLDIETAPHKCYAWGLWDQNIGIDQIEESGYTLCWAAQWYGQKEMMFDSVYNSNPEAMINGIYDLINEADIIVHFNGLKFDMPILNQEFLKHGLTPPRPYKQVDLLRTARSRFRLPSNKLDYVARFLGLGSKLKHKGMLLWTECMAGDEKAWKTMEKYNKQDVVLLRQVYDALLPWIVGHPNMALYTDDERPVCTNCGGSHVQKRGVTHTNTFAYQRYWCVDCGTNMRGRHNVSSKKKRENTLVAVR